MIRTSQLAHVGPMAAVAGAVAESVSRACYKVLAINRPET
jgi:ApbE superfamily uncharacterized protein (UPF0280 family)